MMKHGRGSPLGGDDRVAGEAIRALRLIDRAGPRHGQGGKAILIGKKSREGL
jgi:hypothetical protein